MWMADYNATVWLPRWCMSWRPVSYCETVSHWRAWLPQCPRTCVMDLDCGICGTANSMALVSFPLRLCSTTPAFPISVINKLHGNSTHVWSDHLVALTQDVHGFFGSVCAQCRFHFFLQAVHLRMTATFTILLLIDGSSKHSGVICVAPNKQPLSSAWFYLIQRWGRNDCFLRNARHSWRAGVSLILRRLVGAHPHSYAGHQVVVFPLQVCVEFLWLFQFLPLHKSRHVIFLG